MEGEHHSCFGSAATAAEPVLSLSKGSARRGIEESGGTSVRPERTLSPEPVEGSKGKSEGRCAWFSLHCKKDSYIRPRSRFLASQERGTAGWGSPARAALAPPCFNENEGGSAAGSLRSTPLHVVSLPKTTTSGLSHQCRSLHSNNARAPTVGAR